MILEKCAFCGKETLIGTPSKGICNLFYDGIRFYECENIAILKCPYKLYACGEIDKEELNKQINKILDEKGANNGRHKQKEN